MNTGSRKSLAAGVLPTALLSALLLAPLASGAQTTLFGSGGTTNAATSTDNLAFGFEALFNNSGFYNTAIGNYALTSNTTGDYNTAMGYWALTSNTTGDYNTANGEGALYSNTTGYENTANGYIALAYNTTGYYNTANGYEALLSNTTGSANTANGVGALFYNTTGSANTANGFNTLAYNTTGYNNTASGYEALLSNTTGINDVANGAYAFYSNTTGAHDTANGEAALYHNTTGFDNTATGSNALYDNINGSYNTADGYNALANSKGAYNTAFGYAAGNALTSGSNNIDISNTGVAGESGAIRIGTIGTQTSTYIAGINGVTTSGGVAVYINANGQLGTLTSSRRFKRDIKDMGSVSDKLMKLRPVTFRYKDSAEKGPHALQYGLIAEEVAKVYPDLVQYDKQGKPFTIYYHLLTPMLLNELQKEHRQNVAQNARITALTVARNTDRREIATLKVAHESDHAEIAALKQAQQQQLAALEQLTALVQNSQGKSPVQSAAYTQH